MPTIAEKRATFRKLHAAGCFVIPNPWDIGTARILAGMGFRALATTSAGMAFSLGVPEGCVSTEDTLRHCRAIVAATISAICASMSSRATAASGRPRANAKPALVVARALKSRCCR